MVAALTLTLFAVFAPGPVAAFSAPSVVQAGSPVTYVDHSREPAPGHHITLEVWIGRQTSFAAPGSYNVTLMVQDDRGLRSSTSHTITVVGAQHHPPVVPSASLALSRTSLRRGDMLTVSLLGAPAAQDIRLQLPPSFLQTVSLPTGPLDYAQVNAGTFTLQGGACVAQVWVPWTHTTPADGSYTLQVSWSENGQAQSLGASFTVQGEDHLAIWTGG